MLTSRFLVILLAAASVAGLWASGSLAVSPAARTSQPRPIIRWESTARLRHRITSTSGMLVLDQDGIHFRPRHGVTLHWRYRDVQSFYVTAHRLEIETYENRGWNFPGVKRFHFRLGLAVPPQFAAALAARVGKPSRNGVPDPHAVSFAAIPARHPSRMGGSNGILRFGAAGIDYVTPSGRDSRSWRWADIQTLANPDRYHFTVGGYCETFDFDLKRPMSPALFDRLWDFVYGRGLQLSVKSGQRENRPRISQSASGGK